jgi:threonylcarbamoyladenosine tRNA methylthiotransferase MtaB
VTNFSIENFGCRATEADASVMREELAASGMILTPEHSSADVVVLNTCTVTAAADSQTREAVRKIHRSNPAARIIVTGCYAQRAPEELATIEGVSWVVGNSHQSEIPRLVSEPAFSPSVPHNGVSTNSTFVALSQLEAGEMSLARGPAKILTGDIFAQTVLQPGTTALPGGDRTRPILKIQDGCSNRCSYCVIPLVRGRSRSLTPDVAVKEIEKLVAAGAREIVLSGINLGSYGRDLSPREELPRLVPRILAETQIDRLRFSSIEPLDITEDFVALVASSPRLAPHFHIPLQSGSDRILRSMRRWYRAAHYAERVSIIRRLIPHAAIGADVIVGFPGETDEDFQTTADFIERMPFTYLHVFSYSPRPGTEAMKSDSFVPAHVIRERAGVLRALGQEKAAAFRRSQTQRTFRALTLHRGGDDWTESLTGNYLKIRIPGRHPANEWHEVRVSG